MSSVDVVVEVRPERTVRVRQLEGMFDAPHESVLRFSKSVECDLDWDWGVGLIVGPSGSGKTTFARKLFPGQLSVEPIWTDLPVVDDFPKDKTIEEIASICGAVGFNTIPSWKKPYAVLSNGEQFRVSLARRLIEAGTDEPAVCDEFTSVVDRQVAKIASHAVQKYIRRGEGLRFVAATCHYDVEEWLRPDWVIDTSGSGSFRRGSPRQRPEILCRIAPVSIDAWSVFSRYHYMSSSLHRASRCWGLWVGDDLVSFGTALWRPQRGNSTPIWGSPRGVTLPDYQGLGLIMVLNEAIGSGFKARGCRFRLYPAHPSIVRSLDRSPAWALKKKPGLQNRFGGVTHGPGGGRPHGPGGGRPNAVFEYVGPASEPAAVTLIDHFETNTNRGLPK